MLGAEISGRTMPVGKLGIGNYSKTHGGSSNEIPGEDGIGVTDCTM
jgi:hypothetical protein